MRYLLAVLSATGNAFAPVMAMWPCRVNHADRDVLSGVKPVGKSFAPPGQKAL